jgi:peptidoglycan hydrolase CwlO-like protein
MYRTAGEQANQTLNELREQLSTTDSLLGQAQQRIKSLEAEVLALKTPKETADGA